MKFVTRLTVILLISALIIAFTPVMAIANGAPQMMVANSVVLDPIDDLINPGPTYVDIKKSQVNYQADEDLLVFSLNLAGVIPSEPEENPIIYNWYLDTNMDNGADYVVSVSWTPFPEWVYFIRNFGTSQEVDLEDVTTRNGSCIRVKLDMGIIEAWTGDTLMEFQWWTVTRRGPGVVNIWDVSPEGAGIYAYWSR